MIRDAQLGNPESEAAGLNNLAAVYMRLEDDGRAISLAQEALALQQSVTGTLGASAAGSLNNLARYLLCADQPDEAIRYAEQAVALNRELGTGVGLGLSTYAEALWKRGQVESAKEPFEEALIAQREVGDQRNEIGTLVSFAEFLFDTARAAEAVGVLGDCLRLMRDLHDPRADEIQARLRRAEAAAADRPGRP